LTRYGKRRANEAKLEAGDWRLGTAARRTNERADVTRSTIASLVLALLAGLSGAFLSRAIFAPDSRATSDQMLVVGDRRIDLDLPDIRGRSQSLAQFDGAPLIINFWATWCPPCVRELPMLDAWHGRRDTDGMTVLAIAVDADTDAVIKFVEDNALTLPVWIAPTGQVDASTRFGNGRNVLPYSVLIGADGRVLAQRAGELDEQVLEEWAKLASPTRSP
jgi:thiol-disulfide isomerase/thioredoxin